MTTGRWDPGLLAQPVVKFVSGASTSLVLLLIDPSVCLPHTQSGGLPCVTTVTLLLLSGVFRLPSGTGRPDSTTHFHSFLGCLLPASELTSPPSIPLRVCGSHLVPLPHWHSCVFRSGQRGNGPGPFLGHVPEDMCSTKLHMGLLTRGGPSCGSGGPMLGPSPLRVASRAGSLHRAEQRGRLLWEEIECRKSHLPGCRPRAWARGSGCPRFSYWPQGGSPTISSLVGVTLASNLWAPVPKAASQQHSHPDQDPGFSRICCRSRRAVCPALACPARSLLALSSPFIKLKSVFLALAQGAPGRQEVWHGAWGGLAAFSACCG